MVRPFTARLLRTYLVISTVVLAAVAITGLVTLSDAVRSRTLARLESVAALVATVSAAVGSPIVDALPALGDSISVTFHDSTGAEVGASGEGRPLPVLLARASSLTAPLSGSTRVAGTRRAYAISPAGPGGEFRFVYASTPVPLLDEAARTTFAAILAFALAGAVLVGAYLLRVSLSIDRSIEQVRAGIHDLERDGLRTPVVATGAPEVRALAGDLNRMAEALNDRIAAIDEQRSQLEATLKSMVEAVIVLDERMFIVRMNEAAGRLMDVDPQVARGRTLLAHVRNAQLQELAEAAIERGETIERTVTLYRDRTTHVQVHASPVRNGHGSRSAGSLLVMTDVTRLKQLEETRKDFVANVSHELKTPITSIIGFVETLLESRELDAANVERFLTIIHSQASRLHLIVEDLLSLSRLERSDRATDLRRFAVSEVFDRAVAWCATAVRDRRIELVRSGDESIELAANASLVEQALVNLVDNAIKYSPEGSRIDLSVEADEERVRLRVTDEGQGIRPQELDRVFERFYRTDAARTLDREGTGLGLAIVKHIALIHGGDVAVESTFGAGSVFTIILPKPAT